MEKINRVRLWSARPDALSPAHWRQLSDVLDAAEHRQAGRFHFAADRRAYVLAHGLRRLALAWQLQVPAASLVFGVTASGQPQLRGPARRPLFFSHSHTREAVLLALSSDAAVGVDVESTRGPAIDGDLLQNFISPPTDAPANAAQSGAGGAGFFFYWTALEAYWKAVGTGLSERQPRLHFERSAAGHWWATPGPSWQPCQPALIFALAAPPACCASLAVRSAQCRGTEALDGHAHWQIETLDFERDGQALTSRA